MDWNDAVGMVFVERCGVVWNGMASFHQPCAISDATLAYTHHTMPIDTALEQAHVEDSAPIDGKEALQIQLRAPSRIEVYWWQ